MKDWGAFGRGHQFRPHLESCRTKNKMSKGVSLRDRLCVDPRVACAWTSCRATTLVGQDPPLIRHSGR